MHARVPELARLATPVVLGRFSLPDTFAATLTKMPKHGWTPAYDGDGQVREGAWAADVTGLLDLAACRRGCE